MIESRTSLEVLREALSCGEKGQITGPIIETCWGKGYRLHETVYDQIFNDDPSVKRSSV